MGSRDKNEFCNDVKDRHIPGAAFVGVGGNFGRFNNKMSEFFHNLPTKPFDLRGNLWYNKVIN